MQTLFSVVAVSFEYTSPRKCQLTFYRIPSAVCIATAHTQIQGAEGNEVCWGKDSATSCSQNCKCPFFHIMEEKRPGDLKIYFLKECYCDFSFNRRLTYKIYEYIPVSSIWAEALLSTTRNYGYAKCWLVGCYFQYAGNNYYINLFQPRFNNSLTIQIYPHASSLKEKN